MNKRIKQSQVVSPRSRRPGRPVHPRLGQGAKRLIVLLLCLLAFTPVSVAAHPPRAEIIAYRITDAPLFADGPEGVCLFTGTVAVETITGLPLGTTTLCVEDVDEQLGPPYRFIESGWLAVELPQGELRFEVTFTDTYTDQTAAAHSASGTLSEGSGRYHGAIGTLREHGPILFDVDGTPVPFLTYSVKLRLAG